MRPKINLCVYNHIRWGILDQIWFAEEVFSQNGYELICTSTLRPDCVNLLIENFTERDIDACEAFCRRFNKQIGIVMTEHIELREQGFSFNGSPLRDAEYIGNKEQRLFNILALADSVFGFFTFGELPELRTWSEILPSRPIHRLPYPSTRRVVRSSVRRDYDIVFTGASTPYRDSVLKQVAKKYRLVRAESANAEEERTNLYASAKVAINIPQRQDWEWISPMRILFGLRAGTPTVHLGQRDTTMFSKLVLEPIELSRAIEDHGTLFRRQISAYENLVNSEYNNAFPAGIFDAWAKSECLS